MKTKNIFWLSKMATLLPVLLLLMIGCKKESGIYTEPSYTSFKLIVSTTGEEKFYQMMVGNKVILDSLGNRGFNNWIEAGDKPLRIKKLGEDRYFIDTLLHFVPGKALNFTMFELDPALDPILLPDDYLQTTPPQPGNLKFSFINADITYTKGKTIDLKFFDINSGDFIPAGELKSIPYGQPSDFIELPGTGTYYIEIIDHQTGQVIIAADTYQGGMVYDSYDGNNTYLMKYYNTNTDPVSGYDFYSAEIIIASKL